jgi:hypothetical protein
MKIYFQPNVKRLKELEYFETVKRSFPNFEHIKKNYRIEESLLNKTVSSESLINNLKKDNKLPFKRKTNCINELEKLPHSLKVALSPTDISFDFVITNENGILFIEFHEIQHCKLKVSRPSNVFDEKDNLFLIPRYLQRLIRDVWRIQNFKCFDVVWWDWYEENKLSYKLSFTNDFKEFYKINNFSFTNFVNNAS